MFVYQGDKCSTKQLSCDTKDDVGEEIKFNNSVFHIKVHPSMPVKGLDMNESEHIYSASSKPKLWADVTYRFSKEDIERSDEKARENHAASIKEIETGIAQARKYQESLLVSSYN